MHALGRTGPLEQQIQGVRMVHLGKQLMMVLSVLLAVAHLRLLHILG